MANKSKYTLQEVTSPQLAREFLNLPKRIYKGNRNWVCPLDEDIEKVFDPARNPLFGDGEAIRWLVRNRKNEVVGRIAAFYNREQAAIEEQPTGGCGFFEAINDQEVADLLFDAARMWLASRGMDKPVATIVTQTVVSKDDPAFQNPTKPVGAFYDKETADRIAAEKGYTMVEDAGRGYRQVVPSPKPFDIVEKASIKALVDAGHVVIAVGGGGIPVIREGSKLSGTPAVIDKDFGSELLAELLDADMLIILTAVEKVAINYNKPDQKGLDDLTPAEAYKYMEENQFAKGSMLPKVQAAVKFAESKAGRTALITLLEKAKDGIEGKTGTRIHQ